MSPSQVAAAVVAMSVLATRPAAARPIDEAAARPDLEHPTAWGHLPPSVRPGEARAEAQASPPPAPQVSAPSAARPAPRDLAPQPLPQRACWTTASQCRQLSITGIVFGGLGLAAIAVGAGLVGRPDEPIPSEPAYQRSTRPPGIVALGMGVGVLVTGILMIVAGQRAWKLGLDRGLQDASAPASEAP